jgi:integrase
MVSNYASGKRRFDSYPTESEAMEAANRLVRQLSERAVLAAALTNEQASEYSSAIQALAPFKLPLSATISTVVEALKLVGDLPSLHAAAKFYSTRHKTITRKPVTEVVQELLAVKEDRGASARYLQDLRYRLSAFSDSCRKDAINVSTSDVQAWLDAQKLKPQSYQNFRRVLHLLFGFAVARGYTADNPVASVESIKVRGGDVGIFKPDEIQRILAAADTDFLPSLVLGAFAGLRSAEIERLDWRDIDFKGLVIVIGASNSKTASRRVVPICDNLASWLSPYENLEGKVWKGLHDEFYDRQQKAAKVSGVKWRPNALRHSYASYRRVAGELGNSAAVVHKHYRELVKPVDAERWFSIVPEVSVNVVAMKKATQ